MQNGVDVTQIFMQGLAAAIRTNREHFCIGLLCALLLLCLSLFILIVTAL